MNNLSDSVRARLNVLIATAVAFAFGLGLASALDLTPVSIAADRRAGPELVIGAPDAPDVTFNGGFADVVDRVAPAVVTVFAEGERESSTASLPFRLPPGFELPPGFGDPDRAPQDQRRLEAWSGSGFIISADGYVLTNNHVVESADKIDIELADQRRYNDVEVVGRDPQTDVALLKIAAEGLPVLPIGSGVDTRVGEWVLAIGSPGFSEGGPRQLTTSVTAGIVSAKGRNIDILGSRFRQQGLQNYAIEDFIQTDAVINRGNSGGPLVNARGEVIGINTAIASTTGGYQGYGFAVPIELAREVVDDLIEFGEVRRALIGVSISDVSSADARYYGLDRVAGAVVGSFSFDGSPARDAGIQIGDVIVAVEGQAIQGVSDLQRLIRGYDPGETVTLSIVRRSTKAREDVRVRLIAADETAPVASRGRTEPSSAFDDPLGIEVSEIDGAARREYAIAPDVQGVVIRGGDRRGAIGRLFSGVPEGIVISDINGERVTSVDDYRALAGRLQPGDAVSLRFQVPADRAGETWTSQIRSLVIPRR